MFLYYHLVFELILQNFILDGYPRVLKQAETLNTILDELNISRDVTISSLTNSPLSIISFTSLPKRVSFLISSLKRSPVDI